MSFVIGQRWLSHADPQLGLGIIVGVETRRVTVAFPAVEEERTYSLDNAPLSRVTYRPGDTIQIRDEHLLTVTATNELRGLLIYTGVDAEGREQTVTEQQLSARVQLDAPQQRLSSGQCDTNELFALRFETLQHIHRQQQTATLGLLGARTSLLPHQIYIAHQVAQRYAPRVLLADEVGLGKTIEAGLIMHQQLLAGRAQRVLIVVPTSLQHQWLVEMLRRFNLRFALFDAERFAAMTQTEENEADAVNPFEAEQLVLCAIDWLAHTPAALACAQAAGWDLLIADEVHHLHWSEHEASPEYRCVEGLAARSAGLILLTATPEQAGVDSHFARLRLLDPARFHDLAQFKAEAARYPAINALVQQLQDKTTSVDKLLPQLRTYFGADFEAAGNDADALIRELLDRHGTSRVLFRNTRAAVQGFPERHMQPVALPLPAIYAERTDQLYPESESSDAQWLAGDPRVGWLEQFLKKIRPAKVLVICAQARTAIALEQYLHLRAGIRSAAFHEGLTLLERDRAAAWFADTDLGAQTLVCSEIGSEGRNFQFAQHLVLFDLPLNPDLLEQRIGRLDRIGQGPRIDIHVPYLEGSAQEILFRWYHEGLDAFRRSFAAGFAVYEQFEPQLIQQMLRRDAKLETLLADTARTTENLRAALQQGRDALLELNSCNPAVAQPLIENVIASERGDLLQQYLQRVWDNFGVDYDVHSEHAVVVRPSEHMLVSHFPELNEDGFTATFSRQQALQRDDMEFLSWEHPMFLGVAEMFAGAEYGNAALASINIKGLTPGTLLLEAIYTVSSPAPRELQVQRFLPLNPLRLLVDRSGKNLSAVLAHDKLNTLSTGVARTTAPAVIAKVRNDIAIMQEHAAKFAAAQLPALIDNATQKMQRTLSVEIERLVAMQRVNPTIRPEEIDFFRTQLTQGTAAIAQASLQLQGLRLIVST